MPASNSGSSGQIVVAGAGYAGLHVALRLTARLRNHPKMELTLVDRHGYHQVLTELPRVAAGTRAAGAVRIPLQDVLATGGPLRPDRDHWFRPARQAAAHRSWADRLEAAGAGAGQPAQ